jgi:YbbR domain-containing protein
VVNVQILPAPVERVLHGVPIRLMNRATNLTAQSSPATVDLTVRGTREGLSHLVAEDINAHVDVAGLGAGQYTLAVHADAMGDTGVTHIEPAMVQVQVSIVKN